MIKRLIIRLLLLVFVVLLLAPWALKRENGTRIMSLDEFFSFDMPLIVNRYKEAVTRIRNFIVDDMEVESLRDFESMQPKTKTLYKWKDDKGEWNFTDHIPKDYPYEEIVVEMNTNVFEFEDIKNKNDESNKSDKDEKGKE